MARTAGTFGSVEQMASGQWRARYSHQGKRWTAPEPFATDKLARGYLGSVKFAIESGTWLPPEKAHPQIPNEPKPVPTVAEFAESWITKRESGAIGTRKMKPRTAAEYRRLLKATVPDSIAKLPVDQVTAQQIRDWYDGLCAAKRPTQTSRAYAFLKTVFTQAMPEHMGELAYVTVNPCQVGGAGRHVEPAVKPDDDPQPEDIEALATAIGPKYAAAVYLGAWCALRWGEVSALRRRDLDLTRKVVYVRHGAVWLTGKGVQVADPKTAAGVRTVAIPGHIIPDLKAHMDSMASNDPNAYLFPSRDPSKPVSESSFQHHWEKAREKAGLPKYRFHWLRHAGATWAGQTGATIAELQARLGHTTPAAAMRYQHAAQQRDRDIADRMSNLAKKSKKGRRKSA
ncbi:site-specific integrase [Gordonia polyisoprenivorans]|uniref:tyrosine-type recombinase/integrase n=1 Tax=Gordonia polyisoprenivorans TaxID=84595 RepID=UPI0022346E45|nr:site-specific integrase [Gordonia polyisoprenivorans]